MSGCCDLKIDNNILLVQYFSAVQAISILAVFISCGASTCHSVYPHTIHVLVPVRLAKVRAGILQSPSIRWPHHTEAACSVAVPISINNHLVKSRQAESGKSFVLSRIGSRYATDHRQDRFNREPCSCVLDVIRIVPCSILDGLDPRGARSSKRSLSLLCAIPWPDYSLSLSRTSFSSCMLYACVALFSTVSSFDPLLSLL